MRTPRLRVISVILVLPAVFGCAEDRVPTAPPFELQGPFTVAGRVLATASGTPVAGARLTLSLLGTTTVLTDQSGSFTFSSVPAGRLPLALASPGHLDRTSALDVAGSRQDVTVDLISLAPPFSLVFYRQLARNGFDSQSLTPLLPWSAAPNFFVRTVTEDTGEAIPARVIEGIRRVFASSVPQLSGGRLSMARFEVGTETRPDQDGWVSVTFWRSFPTAGAGGQASVGPRRGGGFIRLEYNSDKDAQGIGNPLKCESAAVSYADHEIVHTMGFFHTDSTFEDFHSGLGCPGNNRPDRVRYHAGIVYARPNGNVDPDRDPVTFATPAGLAGRSVTVSCAFAAFSR